MLKKLFDNIPLVPKEKKLLLADDIISMLDSEWDNQVLPLIYKLSQSKSIEDRHISAKILFGISSTIQLDFNLKQPIKKQNNLLYLESSGIKYDKKNKDYSMQKKWIKSKLDIDIHNLVEEADFSGNSTQPSYEDTIKEVAVTDDSTFFQAIQSNLLSLDWQKRHSGFLLFIALFPPKNLFFKQLFSRKLEKKIIYYLQPRNDLLDVCLNILREDKFSDFINDQTIAPVRECASILLYHLFFICNYKSEVLFTIKEYLEDEDWQTQLSGLLFFKHLNAENYCCVKTDLDFCRIFDFLIENSADEDIKYLACEIKKKSFCKLGNEIILGCISNSNEISLSVASLMDLLGAEENVIREFKILSSSFRHPLKEVRISLLRLINRIFEKYNSDFKLLEIHSELIIGLIMNVLMESNLEILELSTVLLKKIFTKEDTPILLNVLKMPFYKRDLYCYDEQYYSPAGVKQLGNTFFDNKARLLSALIGKLDQSDNKELIGCLINFTNQKKIEMRIKTLVVNLEARNEEDFYRKYDLPVNEGNSSNIMNFKMTDFFKESDLKKLCKNEIIHPRIKEIHQYFLILSAIQGNIGYLIQLTYELQKYFISSLIYNQLICREFILFCYFYEIQVFFQLFNCLFLEEFTDLKKISKIVDFLPKKDSLFDLCIQTPLDGPIAKILNCYVTDFYYADKLVTILLANFDISLFECVIDSIHPNYYILFFKQLINYPHLLSKSIPYLHTLQPINSIHSVKIQEQRNLLADLINNRHQDYKILCPMRIKLREYQKEGVNWIAFLYRYGLNGILADDMGLGKTVQVLSFVCSEIYSSINTTDVNSSINPGVNSGNTTVNPGINTNSTTCNTALNPGINRSVNPGISTTCNTKLNSNTVNSISTVSSITTVNSNKAIKIDTQEYPESSSNPEIIPTFKTKKLTKKELKLLKSTLQDVSLPENKKIKTKKQESSEQLLFYKCLIICPNTLISHWKSEIEQYFPFATQIQIFSYEHFKKKTLQIKTDFLVLDEGHLLRNKDTLTYQKIKEIQSPFKLILSGTPVQNNSTDLVNLFNLLMPNFICNSMDLNTLHKKTLPLILRRLKNEVLEELPDKVITDIVVEMTEYQKMNYKLEEVECDYGTAAQSTGFRKMQRMLRVINGIENEGLIPATGDLFVNNAKLNALNELLRIIKEDSKVLIFCQHRSTIQSILPILTDFSVLDGSVKNKDFVIQDFISNKRILIMTTSVGGLGLNLTCADHVIFYEHDWNPFNDLQAMDRAHRLGQKRTVNVFRLIMKDTLEEKIMNYQQFKVFVANKIVNYENRSIHTMELSEVIERMNQAEEVSEDEDFVY